MDLQRPDGCLDFLNLTMGYPCSHGLVSSSGVTVPKSRRHPKCTDEMMNR